MEQRTTAGPCLPDTRRPPAPASSRVSVRGQEELGHCHAKGGKSQKVTRAREET